MMLNGSSSLLEVGANSDRLREELLLALEELSRRRRRLWENRPLLLQVGAGALMAVALLLWARTRYAPIRRARSRRERWRSLARAWSHPERLAQAPQAPWSRFGSAVANRLGVRMADHLLSR